MRGLRAWDLSHAPCGGWQRQTSLSQSNHPSHYESTELSLTHLSYKGLYTALCRPWAPLLSIDVCKPKRAQYGSVYDVLSPRHALETKDVRIICYNDIMGVAGDMPGGTYPAICRLCAQRYRNWSEASLLSCAIALQQWDSCETQMRFSASATATGGYMAIC